jgi:4-aminobutyrate aminotransferase
VSCAAANATLDVIEDERLAENAAQRGRQLLHGLREVAARHPSVGDVRGLGCMLGLEFVDRTAPDPRAPDAGMVRRVVAEALDRKLILLTCGSFGQVVRLIPPLVTTTAEVDQAIEVIDAAIGAAERG